jgi:hypothetical protein
VLQSLDIPADDRAPSAPAAKPVKLNAVVTKGHIRVVPTPGLQGVAPQQADAANLGSSSPDFAALDPGHVEPAGTDPDSSVRKEQPVAADMSAPWYTGLSERSGASQPIDSAILPLPGLSMKMIKLSAAAAVLGVVAIALTFLQFFGSESEGQTVSQGFAPVVSSADANRLSATRAPQPAIGTGDNSADIVAQITAGTLAALRNGPAKTPTSPVSATAVASAPMDLGASNGLYAMVLTALQQGQSRQYIDQMVNEAHRSQKVEVPALLLTSSGEVNTTALLTLFGGQ